MIRISLMLMVLACLVSNAKSDLDTFETTPSPAPPHEVPSFPQLNFPYERSYTVVVHWGAEACFFIEDIFPGNLISFSFLVLNSDPNSGARMGVTAEIRDKYGQAMWTEPWRDTSDVDDIYAREEGDYQICFFNSKYGPASEKLVSWDISIDGKYDQVAIEESVAQMMQEKMEEGSERVIETIKDISTKTHKVIRYQWQSKFAHSKDVRYVEALTA